MQDSIANSQAPQRFRFAEFELSTLPGELLKAGSKRPLQPQPCRALALLLTRAGEVVTRQELREHLWGAETFLDHEQGINFTIRKIRTALDDDPAEPRFIETVPRLGYRFVAPVERIAGQTSSRAPQPTETLRPWTRPRLLALGSAAIILLVFLTLFASSRRGLSPAETTKTPSPPPSIPAPAYEAYLQGRYLLGQGGKESAAKAIAAFERATMDAPDFASAHAALASAHLRKRFTKPSSEVAPAATAAARKALELEEGLAEAHLALATVHLYFEMDWPAAENAFRRALELDPTSARALHGYGLYLASLGHLDEAIATVRRAVALDPTDLYIISDLSLIYFWDRRYDAAIAQARDNLEANAGDIPSLGLIVDATMQRSDDEGTLKALNEIFQTTGQPLAADLETALARSLEHMVAVDEGGYHLDVEIAAAWIDRGQTDLAMERLQRACAERSDWMVPFIAVDPRFDPLRARSDYGSLTTCLAPRAETGAWVAHLPG